MESVCEIRESSLTVARREAISLALEMGYLGEPRGATLDGVADALDISQHAAGELLWRGLRRLAVSTVVLDVDDPAAER